MSPRDRRSTLRICRCGLGTILRSIGSGRRRRRAPREPQAYDIPWVPTFWEAYHQAVEYGPEYRRLTNMLWDWSFEEAGLDVHELRTIIGINDNYEYIFDPNAVLRQEQHQRREPGRLDNLRNGMRPIIATNTERLDSAQLEKKVSEDLRAPWPIPASRSCKQQQPQTRDQAVWLVDENGEPERVIADDRPRMCRRMDPSPDQQPATEEEISLSPQDVATRPLMQERRPKGRRASRRESMIAADPALSDPDVRRWRRQGRWRVPAYEHAPAIASLFRPPPGAKRTADPMRHANLLARLFEERALEVIATGRISKGLQCRIEMLAQAQAQCEWCSSSWDSGRSPGGASEA